MNKRFSVVARAFGLATVLAVFPGSGPAAATGTPHQEMYRSSKIVGATVRNADQRKIGVIKDLMLDSQRGEIAYAVISFGGVMGVGEKYHAVPWTALSPGENGRFYVLRADKETIANAPGFDKGKWPDIGDPKWNAEIDNYWNRLVGRAMPPHGRLPAPGVNMPADRSSGR